jgi:hypothetical protein
MSAAVDQFCDRLRDQLNAIEGRFESFKAEMQSLPQKAETAVRGKLEEVRNNLQAQEEHIERTRAMLQALAQKKVTETEQAVSEWKAKRETRKLQVRADRSEVYAADAIAYALATIDEAEEAVLDAAVARMDADAAQ